MGQNIVIGVLVVILVLLVAFAVFGARKNDQRSALVVPVMCVVLLIVGGLLMYLSQSQKDSQSRIQTELQAANPKLTIVSVNSSAQSLVYTPRDLAWQQCSAKYVFKNDVAQIDALTVSCMVNPPATVATSTTSTLVSDQNGKLYPSDPAQVTSTTSTVVP